MEQERECRHRIEESDLIQQELDLQWQLYRVLNEAEKHDVALIQDLKNELREEKNLKYLYKKLTSSAIFSAIFAIPALL